MLSLSVRLEVITLSRNYKTFNSVYIATEKNGKRGNVYAKYDETDAYGAICDNGWNLISVSSSFSANVAD